MGCNKIKNTCIDNTHATCVDYELDISNISNITEDCVTIEDTTQDLYQLVESLQNKIGVEENEVVADLIDAQSSLIETLQQKVEILENQNVCEQSIEDCNLELQGLVDICGEQPDTVGDLLQIIVNQITQ
mgnify:CR=1 FL=1